MVYLKVQEILHMKDIGKMILNIQLELKFGKIILFIKVIFHMEKNGIGSYFWPDKSYYKGEWKDNLINGYGIYVFSSNKIYRGEFKNNQFEGYGEFMHDNDHIYMGNFVKDKKEGFGFFIWNFLRNNEKKAYLGFWKDNKMNGYGRIFHKNASRFSIWKKGKKN